MSISSTTFNKKPTLRGNFLCPQSLWRHRHPPCWTLSSPHPTQLSPGEINFDFHINFPEKCRTAHKDFFFQFLLHKLTSPQFDFEFDSFTIWFPHSLISSPEQIFAAICESKQRGKRGTGWKKVRESWSWPKQGARRSTTWCEGAREEEGRGEEENALEAGEQVSNIL